MNNYYAPMRIADLIDAMQRIAPIALAGDWDNVGLIVGDPEDSAQKRDSSNNTVLLTIDLTPSVVDEAIALSTSAIVAYHPPIFRAINRVVGDGPRSRALLRVIERRIAVYSPHSALDAAHNGMGDWLLDRCAAPGAFTDRRAIEPAAMAPTSQPGRSTHKVVVFVPEADADRVRTAMADAGAGIIGAYTRCSFASEGTGTFLGDETTNPAVGERGTLEHARELRLEMVSPAHLLGEVIAAATTAHPYEEPALDVYPLVEAPNLRIGAGRIGRVSEPTDAQSLAERVRTQLGVSSVKLADAGRPVRTIACCPGAGSSLLKAAAGLGADAFVTGEMSHHDVLAALDRGVSVVLAGHTNTERGFLPTLAGRLRDELPGSGIRVSTADAAPMRTI